MRHFALWLWPSNCHIIPLHGHFVFSVASCVTRIKVTTDRPYVAVTRVYLIFRLLAGQPSGKQRKCSWIISCRNSTMNFLIIIYGPQLNEYFVFIMSILKQDLDPTTVFTFQQNDFKWGYQRHHSFWQKISHHPIIGESYCTDLSRKIARLKFVYTISQLQNFPLSAKFYILQSSAQAPGKLGWVSLSFHKSGSSRGRPPGLEVK